MYKGQRDPGKTASALAMGLLVLFLWGCTAKEKAGGKTTGPVPVRVEKVQLQDLRKVLEYVGNIKGQEEAQVYPKVSGKILEKVKDEGAAVAKGDVIVYIDRDEVGLKFEKAPVESPLAGVVGRVYVDIGANVTAQTPVALVVAMDNVKIELSLPEKYIGKVLLEQEAEILVDAYPEKKFSGKVTKISPVLDMETRSALAEITVDNKEHLLKSGMFAKIKLTVEKREGIPVIRQEALLGKGEETYVFVIENAKAYLRKVQIDIQQGPYVGIREGLKSGDAVVILGQQNLSDGVAVRIGEGA